MIEPPVSWFCMTALACWATDSGPSRFSSMILVLNLAEASAVSTYGEPPALFTTTSSRPCRSTMVLIRVATDSSSRTSQDRNSCVEFSPGRRAHVTTVAP
jgi:hypothetical protein